MLAVNVTNSTIWTIFLYLRLSGGLDESAASLISSAVAGLVAIIGLGLSFSRYAYLSGWILVVTSTFSTFFTGLYLEPLRAGYALFFLSVPVAIGALMISGRAGIGSFVLALVAMAIVFGLRRDLPIESIIPPASFVIYISAIIIVATFVKERFENLHKAKLSEASKMASLGLMSASIAHEINNALFVLDVTASHLEELTFEDELDRQKLFALSQKISDMAHRIDHTVRGMKQFTREASADPIRPTRVCDILTSTKSLCHQRFTEEGIALTIADVPSSLMLDCRSVQISQVLVNLLNNAIDAVALAAEKWVKIEVIDEGGSLSFVVTDSGRGIPPEFRQRIMNPFFTTKAEGKGTGLGLSLSVSIAKDHGGRLYLDDSSPVTRFVLELPKTARAS